MKRSILYLSLSLAMPLATSFLPGCAADASTPDYNQPSAAAPSKDLASFAASPQTRMNHGIVDWSVAAKGGAFVIVGRGVDGASLFDGAVRPVLDDTQSRIIELTSSAPALGYARYSEDGNLLASNLPASVSTLGQALVSDFGMASGGQLEGDQPYISACWAARVAFAFSFFGGPETVIPAAVALAATDCPKRRSAYCMLDLSELDPDFRASFFGC